MNKIKLEELINYGSTQREIGKKLNLSQTTVRYWLKKYNLKTLDKKSRKGFKPYLCRRCGETNFEKFYGNKKEICGNCSNQENVKRQKERKAYARKKLGGKCVVCDFKKYQNSLDIHHLNSDIKDKYFKSMSSWSIKRIDREIKNCVLLCKNCHTAYHTNKMSEENKNKIISYL